MVVPVNIYKSWNKSDNRKPNSRQSATPSRACVRLPPGSSTYPWRRKRTHGLNHGETAPPGHPSSTLYGLRLPQSDTFSLLQYLQFGPFPLTTRRPASLPIPPSTERFQTRKSALTARAQCRDRDLRRTRAAIRLHLEGRGRRNCTRLMDGEGENVSGRRTGSQQCVRRVLEI